MEQKTSVAFYYYELEKLIDLILEDKKEDDESTPKS